MSRVSSPTETKTGSFLLPGAPMERSKSALRRDVLEQKNELGPKLVVVMVGLPARGKSYICKKLNRYLCWLGFNTKVFNVGNRRRVMASINKNEAELAQMQLASALSLDKSAAADNPVSSIEPIPASQHDAKFFRSDNQEAKKWREQLALESLEELIGWLHVGGKIGILDATNSTIERRQALLDRVSKEKNMMVLFCESICTQGPVLDANIEMKLSGPDYINVPRQQAIADFKERIHNYEMVYQTLAEVEENNDISYVKIINIGKKVITHNIYGYLQSHCVFYLMQLNIKRRTIWVTRHGESLYNVENRIGGDPALTESGKAYGKALGKFLTDYYKKDVIPPKEQARNDYFGTVGSSSVVNVWTSTLRRTIETVDSFDDKDFDIKHVRYLNEIYAGGFENLTYEEYEEHYPEEFRARQKNKLVYRYPGAGGESYVDVIERLRPLIIELERMESDTIICTHNVVMRTLVAYFLGLPLEQMPTLNIPLHTLYCLEPTPYGCNLKKYKFKPEEDVFELEL